ncbi:SDR family NAD(P)-dependent oxidoreductase [Carboxylicivirga marina]|uniref:SDR family NAD(P)-dependent oxidoreductase n=1 Tax=Carboxylicivirga marina TaxID=2800988 RepID=A0ABS1HI78_9BACT|nr:SDR family NAD(P)-dependent oxidoreductase [Carboxylicivirga marina]MBK3517331.1 SDR family NAD(P)-dependent oxidoreductase [Carboxylicivirga marina]
MDLQIKNHTYIVCGATAGFGRATAIALMNDGAKVIGIARQQEGLDKMAAEYQGHFIAVKGDMTTPDTINKTISLAVEHEVKGILINAGGPPAKLFEETRLSDWDDAYRNILRWKVELTQKLLPHFKSQNYGRVVYIESSSVKQPYENLVLSTSLRLAVVGMMKTVSQEVSGQNINFNMIAPGSHDTAAINRLIDKKAQMTGQDFETTKEAFIEGIPAKQFGNPKYLGQLAAWLLSPMAEFATGQVYALEGGAVKSTL